MMSHSLRAILLCGTMLSIGVSQAFGGGIVTDRNHEPASTATVVEEACGTGAEGGRQLLVYVGTYTNGNSKGIYHYRMDLATGKLTPAGVTSGIKNPSFLAIHPNHRFLYAVNEVSDFPGKAGAVSAYAIDPATGNLTFLNQQSSTGGAPCHLVVDKAGKNVLVANYTGGNVAVLPISPDGRVREASSTIQHRGSSANPRRQEGPHAHSINLDPANRFAFAADLGLDKVLVYRFDPKQGTLSPNNPPAANLAPGSGPRHFALHPSNRYAYVINELLSTITAFSYDGKRGELKEIQTITTLPEGYSGTSFTAEVLVHPSGKFLYGSNRGHDSITIYSIDQKTGRLKLVGHQSTRGKTPRNFNIDPTGAYLLAANQGSNSIVVFRINPITGELTPTDNVLEVPAPVCIKFLPARR